MKAVNIERQKESKKSRNSNGIECKASGQMVDSNVCIGNQMRKPKECFKAGCKHFKS